MQVKLEENSRKEERYLVEFPPLRELLCCFFRHHNSLHDRESEFSKNVFWIFFWTVSVFWTCEYGPVRQSAGVGDNLTRQGTNRASLTFTETCVGKCEWNPWAFILQRWPGWEWWSQTGACESREGEMGDNSHDSKQQYKHNNTYTHVHFQKERWLKTWPQIVQFSKRNRGWLFY